MKIAIFGKLSNLDWGLESLISKSQDRTDIPMALYDDDDIWRVLVDDRITHLVSLQGRRLNREALRRFKGKKILWNAEFLPYPGFENDPNAVARLQAIEPLKDFDLILNGCPLSTKWLRDARGVNANWFPMMGVDPLIHRRIPEIANNKDIDVGFYGTPNERRARIFESIAEPLVGRGKTAYWTNSYGEDLIRFINRCKIVLNIHFTDQLNTESRIYEVFGCGTLCLSETVSSPEVVPLDILETSTTHEMLDSIYWLLDSDEYVFKLARDGHDYVHSNFNILNVLNRLIDRCQEIS